MLGLRKAYRVEIGPAAFASIALAAALTLLAACTVGPNYVKPTATEPAAYKETPGWKVAEPKDDVVRGAWWEIFNDPLLNTLEEQVDISNQNIAAAEAQFREACALVQAARASYFPQATAGASRTRTRSSMNLPGATSSLSGTSTTSSGVISNSTSPARRSSTSSDSTTSQPNPTSDYLFPGIASWEPDLWGKVRRTVEANRASAQASAADLEGIRLSARALLAQNYFQLRSLDSQKMLYDETVTAYSKFLELTQNQYASGVASRAAVLQAETQLKTTVALGIGITVQRALFEHAIAVLIGKPPSALTIPAAPLIAVPPAIPFGVPSELLERRPDIAAAERLAAAANAQIGVAIAAYFPTVTLTASGGFEGSSLANWLAWPSRFWSVGTAVSELVFDGGLRQAQTKQARAAFDAAVATYRQTVLTGFEEVEDGLASLRILEEQGLAQDDAVRAAKDAVTLTMNDYRQGTVSYLNVIVAQATALSNEITAIQILGSRMSDSVLLIQALGGGWNSSDLPSNRDVDAGVSNHQ